MTALLKYWPGIKTTLRLEKCLWRRISKLMANGELMRVRTSVTKTSATVMVATLEEKSKLYTNIVMDDGSSKHTHTLTHVASTM